MGLDIYFEKHSRTADNSAYEKAEQNLDAVDKQIDELLEAHPDLSDDVYKVVRLLMEDKDTEGYSKELVNLAKDIVPLQKEYNEYSKQVEELNPRKEVAYFRKVNFLIEYFEYGENCSYKEITKEQVIELLERCNQVLDDNSLASELLPTTSGFFFGNTNYDEYYIDKVQNVKETFERLLEETNWDDEIIEMYCWW